MTEMTPEYILATDLWHIALGLHEGGFDEFQLRIKQFRQSIENAAYERAKNIRFDMGSALNPNYDVGTIIEYRHRIELLKTPSSEAQDD